MSDQQESSGERTQEPSEKKLRDARRRGEVDRGREIAPTAALLVATGLVALYAGEAAGRLAGLLDSALGSMGRPFVQAAPRLGWMAARALLEISLTVAVPIAIVALIAEFLNVGPVFSTKPWIPDPNRLNVISGLKRMLKSDNWIELAKSVAKTLMLLTIAAMVAKAMLPRLGSLYRGSPQAFGEAVRVGVVELLGWSVVVFCVVAVIDRLYQRHAFRKRMRMSIRDVRQENREESGDPMIKKQRMQLMREWAQRSDVAAAKAAHLLVVNPTHVAIALDWHPQTVPVPIVAGKGEGDLARMMRRAARKAMVPMLRDVTLARALLDRVDIGETVPEDLYEAVAQAIVWAQSMREQESQEPIGAVDIAED
jgi:type III secretion protein U